MSLKKNELKNFSRFSLAMPFCLLKRVVIEKSVSAEVFSFLVSFDGGQMRDKWQVVGTMMQQRKINVHVRTIKSPIHRDVYSLDRFALICSLKSNCTLEKWPTID